MPSKKSAPTAATTDAPPVEAESSPTPRVNHWRRETYSVRVHDGIAVIPDLAEIATQWGSSRDIPVEVTTSSNGKRTIIRFGRTSRPRSASLFYRQDLAEMRRLGISAADVRTFIAQKRREREDGSSSILDVL